MDFNRPPGGGPPFPDPHGGCNNGMCPAFLVKRRRIDEPDSDSPCASCNRNRSRRVDDESTSDEDAEFSDDNAPPIHGAVVVLQQMQEEPPGDGHGHLNPGEVFMNARSGQLEIEGSGNSNSNSTPAPAGITPAPATLTPLLMPLQSPRTPGPNLGPNNPLARVDELGWQESRPHLTQRAGYLVNNSRMSDVRFLVGETKTEFYAHKTLLALGSPVFEAQFFGSVGSGLTDVIELPDMEPEIFLMFLKYLYTDELESSMDDTQILNLLRPAKKYIVPHLVDKCSEILMTELRPENIFQILNHAQFYQLKKLEGACERYIDRNSEAIARSEDFVNLGKSVLTDFLGRDGLNISEEALFQAVLRWASAECERSSIDATYENMRMALGDCLKLVRFPAMKKEEFAAVFETTNILSPEEACSVFVYMCKSPPNVLSPSLIFPTMKRTFAPQLCIVSRFGGDPLEHSLNYRSGEIYNYRINFKVDRHIFLKGANIFSIRCGPQVVYGNRRDFSGAMYLYEKGTPSYEGRKQFNKIGSLEVEDCTDPANHRRQYYPVMFDTEIAISPGKVYTICVVVSVNSHNYVAPLQTYVGTSERTKSCVMYSEDLVINFTFLGSSADGSVGRFTSAQIPELIFCL